MPVVDVVNLDGKKVGQVELADAVFGAKVESHCCTKLRAGICAVCARARTDQGQKRSQRRGPQALAAEGHGRARRFDSFAALAPMAARFMDGPRDYSYALRRDAPRRAALALSANAADKQLTGCGCVVVDTPSESVGVGARQLTGKSRIARGFTGMQSGNWLAAFDRVSWWPATFASVMNLLHHACWCCEGRRGARAANESNRARAAGAFCARSLRPRG